MEMSELSEWVNDIHQGDSFELLTELPESSVHAVVTDPPYGLAFMGRDWDDFEPKEYQEWCENWARRAKWVLKPGGHLLAFSGNRTHHRLFTGVEDAGYEIRDTLTWHYGSGFPKATDVSKTIDKRPDADREVVGEKRTNTGITGDNHAQESESGTVDVTEAATDDAKRWEGWKTGLKPATEYVVMARKPFDGATVDCVLEHGTGALNIDGTRVGSDGGHEHSGKEDNSTTETCYGDGLNGTSSDPVDKGRYPANVAFDEIEAKRLDDNNPHRSDTNREVSGGGTRNGEAFDGLEDTPTQAYEGSGGPSRYFYTSKASKAERTLDGSIENSHPTVKPQDLMEWLVKLVSREGQIVLDPFAGSGTTCKAAKELGRRFIGMEKQAKYVAVAQARAGLTVDDPQYLADENTATLGEFAGGPSEQ